MLCTRHGHSRLLVRKINYCFQEGIIAELRSPDIDDKSLDYAKRNVLTNGLTSRVAVHRVLTSDPILNPKYVDHHYDFTLCNPPFYASEDEMMESASAKTVPPNSACTGAPNEMICSGGEVAFVTQMIDESVLLRNDIKWFTSMVGKLSSISVLVTKLKVIGITNWAVTEFAPGKQTKRWAIAWSFGGLRPKIEVARGAANLEKKLLPFPSHQSMPVSSSYFLCDRLFLVCAHEFYHKRSLKSANGF